LYSPLRSRTARGRPHACGLALLLALGAPPGAALAQAEPDTLRLTRREAVDTALARNPTLVVAREQVEQARARVVQATAFPDPTFSAELAGEESLLRPGSNNERNLALGLTVPFPQKFHLRGEASRGDLHAAEFGLVQQRQQVAALTVQAYDALLVALRHRADLTESKGLAEDFLRKTEARFEAGTAAKLDVLKARVEVAAAENGLIANLRDLTNARSGLNRLLGRAVGAPVAPADSLELPAELPPLEPLVAAAHRARPDLQGLTSQRAGARAATTLAGQFWMPDLTFGVEKNVLAGTPNSYTSNVGLTVPLFFWNHRRGEVAESRHREDELAAAYRDLSAQADQEVRVAYATAVAALRQARYLRDDLLPEARRAYDIARTSYGLGGSSALEVLDARRTLLDAEGQYADALGAANDARADLERAVGAPLTTVSPGDSR